jgi:hypothetical protein
MVNTGFSFSLSSDGHVKSFPCLASAYNASTAATPATPANAWAARVTIGMAPAFDVAEAAPEEAAEPPEAAADEADAATDDAALAAEPADPAAPVMEL